MEEVEDVVEEKEWMKEKEEKGRSGGGRVSSRKSRRGYE